jgi:hypothetical protein
MSDSPNSRILNDSRCDHRFANGSRCRLSISPDETGDSSLRFCSQHARLPENQRPPVDLSAELTDNLGHLNSPETINLFMDRLLRLFVQDRISTRRAAVFTYMAGQLLRSVSAMREDQAARAKHAPRKIIWSIPGPPREQEMPSES